MWGKKCKANISFLCFFTLYLKYALIMWVYLGMIGSLCPAVLSMLTMFETAPASVSASCTPKQPLF